MKRLFVAALAGVSLLAMTAHAAADPFSIGAFILGNLAAIGGPALAIEPVLIGNIVLAAATTAANVAIGLLNRPKIKPQEYKQTFETSEGSELRAVGRVRVGGLIAFGNTKAKNRYRLYCHLKGPITAKEAHYLGGREVTVDADGSVSSPPWSRSTGVGGWSTPSWVYIQAKNGDGTETVWTDLVSEFPDLWTSAHRLRGIAQSLVKYESPGLENKRFLKLYAEGEPPYETLLRAEPVYDPRDGAQAVDTQSTWRWSDNGILCAAHILRSYPNFTSADFDWDTIAAEATKADALVATLTGTEKRARCSGIWPSENARGDVMQQVLESIGAEIVLNDNHKIAVRLIDDDPASELSFPARHITDIRRRYGPEGVERPNVCVVKYYSPERNYEMAEVNLDGISWARIDDEVTRYGEKQYVIELPFCPSASQAQRIARRMFAIARADTGLLKTNFVGLTAWGRKYITADFPDLNDGEAIAEKLAIDVPRVDDDAGMVEIPFAVWPALPAWNPAIMEAAAPEQVPELQYASDLTQPAQPTQAVQVIYPGGGREVRVAYVEPSGGTSTEAVYRVYDVDDAPQASQSMTEVSGVYDYAWTTANLEGQKLDFRVRIFNNDGDGSYYSTPLVANPLAVNNAPPSAPVLAAGVDPGKYVATVGNNLHVAYVRIEKRFPNDLASWTVVGTGDVRPGGSLEVTISDNPTVGQTLSIRAFAYSSNGTPSASSNVISVVGGL